MNMNNTFVKIDNKKPLHTENDLEWQEKQDRLHKANKLNRKQLRRNKREMFA